MAVPSILIVAQDKALQTQAVAIARALDYQVVQVTENNDIKQQLLSSEIELCLFEVTPDTQAELEGLQNSNLHFYRDFIFISSGLPNQPLDEMMRQGAGYHFRTPIDIKQIEEVLQDYFFELTHKKDVVNNIPTSDIDQFGLLTGSSMIMRKLYRTIRRVAGSNSNVLIQGESGSGKELVAQTIHSQSKRNLQPFIAINCGALSPELIDSELFGHIKGAFTGAHRDHKGIFEQAEGGTLFLDEVTEMPLEQQVKLLRVLESGEYRQVGSQVVKHAKVRILAATNRDPMKAIEEGIFREDLYFRLAQFPIQVPPLRARGKDICKLAKHFLAYRCNEEQIFKSISEAALQKIADYHWPGNVRELRHSIERAFILAETLIDKEHLTFETDTHNKDHSDEILPSGMSLEEIEKVAILQAMHDNNGNKTEAAQQLGISVKTLYNKLEKYTN
ncbi:sigma-54 interaction domain-containing protein [Gayadomonas joobiniege]|uniref:sigma-54 interaction domain-containing protein n=1 Tax=Gayadomonas joobiniege TaxID=1234606 RepID=UPI0003829F1A|nr:sigma-54 dependent transcriptional regulator [Gayadomonas joobiniege]